jgi:hypothetical protein
MASPARAGLLHQTRRAADELVVDRQELVRRFLLNDHRQCMDDMIAFLQLYFSPDKCESAGLSLAISGGTDGARLTHSHERQYNFALQSLSLWREITNDMFKLWYAMHRAV